MVVKKELQKAVLNELLKSEQLMDLAQIRKEFLQWLEQLPFPGNSETESWEDHIREFPAKSGEEQLESGLRVRLNLPLQTKENRYLLSILESLAPTSRNVYIISVHVNWKDNEWQLQKNVEESYTGYFDDAPKASHAIWAQNFIPGELGHALNSCVIAILGHELIRQPQQPNPDKISPKPLPVSVSFPKQSDD
ncbi:MAG: hypothetical protein DRP47_10855 [Candidatus Zixiibacteriota bacterium]|nr:MAG: hypothetical protein DRP47_10855 [candidate division Zixibacteria bacterium]